MRPKGETERSIYERTTGDKADNVFGTLEDDLGSIGFGSNVSGVLKPNMDAYKLAGKIIQQTFAPQYLKNSAPVPDKKSKKTPSVPVRKPEVISPTRKGDELLDFIGQLESSDNYNAIYGGGKKDITRMTIKDVQKLQDEMVKRGSASTAVGRYQIIDDKMDDLIRWMSLDGNTVFDKNLQDQMGRELLRRRGFEKYKAGEISTEDFIKELSQEWAAFPVDKLNKSYYSGVGNNKALTDFKTIKDLLEKK